MGIKNIIINTLMEKDLYKLKKELKEEIAKNYEQQLKEKDKKLKESQELIHKLIKENQKLKLENDVKSLNKDKSKQIEYPSNLID